MNNNSVLLQGPRELITMTSGIRPHKTIRVLLVDLNNFSTFPTLAVGILISTLRNQGHSVKLISPLAHDVIIPSRERKENIYDHLRRRIQYSTWKPFRSVQDRIRLAYHWYRSRPHRKVIEETDRALEKRTDVVLLSAYLEHYSTVRELARITAKRDIPLILGGPAFNLPMTVEAWRSLPGVTAIVGAEVDVSLSAMVAAAVDRRDLLAFPGVTLPDGRRSNAAAPLRDLDHVPVPDFTDFPWDRYPFRVVPLMTGRGCQWDRCTFCSDVVTASGRTFRTRSPESVLNEMREQSRRHETTNFLFLDLKLNSSPFMFRSICEDVQRYVPGAQWIGTVHVDQRKDNGLSFRDLRAAVTSGMRRVSFGLESGSQKVLDLMDKGCTVESNAEFIRNAFQAGLSVRCTMFKGYPGETAADIELTAKFLEDNGEYIDRLRFAEFAMIENTRIHNAVTENPENYQQIRVFRKDYKNAFLRHVNTDSESLSYRRAKARLLSAVFEINRRPVRLAARAFDGLM